MNDFRSGFWLGCAAGILGCVMLLTTFLLLTVITGYPFQIYLQWLVEE